jgi:hypothetical protein
MLRLFVGQQSFKRALYFNDNQETFLRNDVLSTMSWQYNSNYCSEDSASNSRIDLVTAALVS